VHGPFVSDEEVEEIVSHLKSFGPPDYAASVLDGPDEDKESDIDAVLGLNTGGNTTGEDALYDQAVAIVIKDRKCSTSYIQRKLGIGYNKAARLVEQMEEQGLVSRPTTSASARSWCPNRNERWSARGDDNFASTPCRAFTPPPMVPT
jgi:S-DNA-T family DNA segregation ATPase FtsK/SpoIIIE